MALINCPECDCEVSDQAAACPSCGFPVADGVEPQPQTPGPRPVSPPPAATESEERRSIGFFDIISPLLVILGAAAAVFLFQRGDTKHGIYGIVLCVGGVVGTLGLMIGRPWHGRISRRD
jgi:hypothetical protein